MGPDRGAGWQHVHLVGHSGGGVDQQTIRAARSHRQKKGQRHTNANACANTDPHRFPLVCNAISFVSVSLFLVWLCWQLFGYNEWLVRWAHWPPLFDRWEDSSHLALYTTRKPQQMLSEYRQRQANETKDKEKEAAATPAAKPALASPVAATAATASSSEESKQQV